MDDGLENKIEDGYSKALATGNIFGVVASMGFAHKVSHYLSHYATQYLGAVAGPIGAGVGHFLGHIIGVEGAFLASLPCFHDATTSGGRRSRRPSGNCGCFRRWRT